MTTPGPDRQGGGPIRVDLYGAPDCSLCDVVKATLLRVRREVPFDLHEVDITTAPDLAATYRERIPLVWINGRLAFKFRVDEARLRRRLLRERWAERLSRLAGPWRQDTLPADRGTTPRT